MLSIIRCYSVIRVTGLMILSHHHVSYYKEKIYAFVDGNEPSECAHARMIKRTDEQTGWRQCIVQAHVLSDRQTDENTNGWINLLPDKPYVYNSVTRINTNT